MTHSRVSGFFMREAQPHPSYGGACGGAERLAGFHVDRLRQPCMSHHPSIGVEGGDCPKLLEITHMKAISAETLSPITHNHIPVVTTELLAKLYGTEPVRIRQGYSRNAERFIEGKHYYKLTGAALKAFKNEVSLNDFVKIAPTTNHLLLWTERGAARHAKMIETDQAWEVFEKLEDCYFSNKSDLQVAKTKQKTTEARYRVRVIIYDDLFGSCVEVLGMADSLMKIADGIASDLGYRPDSFTKIPMNKNKLKRVY